MFLVTVSQSGPEFDHAKQLEEQTRWTEHAAFMDARRFAADGNALTIPGRVTNDLPGSSCRRAT